jgi:hypothetical protein
MEYLAECYWPGVTDADLADLDARARSASAGDDGPRYLGSHLVPEDEIVLCFFEASSPDAVDYLARNARIPFARIVESVRAGTASREERTA